MRKYQGILFAALFCFAMLLLLAAGLWWYRPRRAEPVPGRVYESERMPENNAVLNPEPEVAEKQSGYCLTAKSVSRPICRSQNFPWKNRKNCWKESGSTQ